MSYFIRILCRCDAEISAEQIESFVREGAYFEPAPQFNHVKSTQSGGLDWERVTIRYDAGKRPVVISNTRAGALLSGELEEIREVTNEIGDSAKNILKHINETRRIVAIEVDRDKLTPDAWEMLDNLESFIASQCNGIIYAPEDGFFDNRLKVIAKI